MTIEEAQEHLTGMSHSGSLGKVRNIYSLFKRAGMSLLSQIRPVETMREATLAQIVHDDLYTYPVPSDFGGMIGIYPQDNRGSSDVITRSLAERFASRRALDNKVVSIEGREGTKVFRINWKSNPAKTLHTMNSLTDNGTVAVVGTATGLKVNTLYKLSGPASIEFDIVATGDGIQVTGMSALDLSDWDELADMIFPVYLGSVANLTSITPIFGNDLTTNFWTCTAQTTQADGTAFRTGLNFIKASWASATESGTVDPAAIDSLKFTFQTTGAISNVRIDNVLFSLGRAFDILYYSKYLFKSSAGTYLSKPTAVTDTIVLDDDDALLAFLFESLKAIAQQVEGEDSAFDINYANKELSGDPSALDPAKRAGIYAMYRTRFQNQEKKEVARYSSGPRLKR